MGEAVRTPSGGVMFPKTFTSPFATFGEWLNSYQSISYNSRVYLHGKYESATIKIDRFTTSGVGRGYYYLLNKDDQVIKSEQITSKSSISVDVRGVYCIEFRSAPESNMALFAGAVTAVK